MSIVSSTIKTVYISGAITTDPDYEQHFAEAEQKLSSMGYTILNPCNFVTAKEITQSGIPEALAYRLCLERDFQAVMFMADAVVDLPSWEQSKGAIAENYLAQFLGVPCFEYDDVIHEDLTHPINRTKCNFNFKD